jgi:hypothetical protein
MGRQPLLVLETETEVKKVGNLPCALEEKHENLQCTQ